MPDYTQIPSPQKILLVNKTRIFYKDTANNIRVFFADKLKDDQYKSHILSHLDSVQIWGSAFCWDYPSEEDDQICIGSDTIWRLSRNINFDELIFLLTYLRVEGQLPTRKLTRALAQSLG